MPRGSRTSSAAQPLPRDQFASHDSSDDPPATGRSTDSGPGSGRDLGRASDAKRSAVDRAAMTAQVKPSRKTRVDATKGAYAPVGHPAGASDSSDLDHSPTGSEAEAVNSTPSPKRKDRKQALADSDLEKSRGGEREKEGWSMTKKLVVGGLALLAVVVIAVVAFLLLHGSKGSDSSSATATSSAGSLASHANETASVASEISSMASNSSLGTVASLAASSAGVASTGLPATLGSGTSILPQYAVFAQQPVQTGRPTPSTAIANAASIGAFETIGDASTGSAYASTVTGGATEHGQLASAPLTSQAEPRPDVAPLDSLVAPSASILPAFDGGSPTAAAANGNPPFPSNVATHTAESVSAQVGTTKISTTATWFGASQHLSACHEVFDDAALVAAVHPALFGSDGSTPSELCDAKLHIWQPDSDQTISVSIQDVCSNCPTPTAIDLTQAAFLKLAPDRDTALDQGVLAVQWWFDDVALQQRLPIGFDQWLRE